MNRNVVIWGGVGFVSGAVIGYLIGDLIAWKIDQRRILKGIRTEEPPEGVIDGSSAEGFDKNLYEFKKDDGIRVNYSGVESKWEEESQMEELVKPYREDKGPYIMTLEEWEDSVFPYDKHTVMYYELDNVYCDEDEQPIDDPQNQFLPNLHLHFGEGSQDDDLVYVCNPALSEKYEVIRMHASYAVEVLGQLPEEEPKKKPVARKRRAAKEVKPDVDADQEPDERE